MRDERGAAALPRRPDDILDLALDQPERDRTERVRVARVEALVAFDPAVARWDPHGRFRVGREGPDEGFGEGDEPLDEE